MVFRKIYWVTEQIDRTGKSQVTGVYTSIPDLLSKGLRWVDGDAAKYSGFRLSLVKLDCESNVLGSWESPGFGSLASDLLPYIETQEFSVEDVQQLPAALDAFCGSGTA